MSLVNDMLNDLDDRRLKRVGEDVNLDWMTGQKVTRKKYRLTVFLWIFGLLALLLIAYKLWGLSNNEQQSPMKYMAADRDVVPQQKNTDVVIKKGAGTVNEEVVDKSSGLSNSEATLTSGPNKISNKTVIEKQEKNIELASEAQEKNGQEPVKTYDYAANDLAEESSNNEVVAVNVSDEKPKVSTNRATPIVQNKLIKRDRVLNFTQTDKKIAKEAEKLIRSGQTKAAEIKLVNYISSQPTAIHSGQLLATIYVSSKDFVKAEKLLSELRLLDPDNVSVISNQARVYLQTDRSSKAVELLMSIQPRLENNRGFYELLGLAARQDSQFKLSLQAYRGLLDLDSSRGDWWVGLAIAHDQSGEFSQARKAYRQAINSSDLTTALRNYAQKRLAVL